jgi:hypothetical protein
MTGMVERVSMSVACHRGLGRAILTTSLADTEGKKNDLPLVILTLTGVPLY